MKRRWLLAAAAALAVLLFAGQWLADFLAARWWAGAIVPEATGFVSGVRLLRLTLDAAAILVATAWSCGHLLIVHRAIGSVQVSRQLANLEIREAVTPSTLLPPALGVAVVLGVLAGVGSGREWPVFALAWQGVTYGITDPYLHRDLGLLVAQLPLWSLLHHFARLLAWGAVLVVVILYAALGALRWQDRRPAISDYARRHVGLLLATAALVLAWGFFLDPYLAAAKAAPEPGQWATLRVVSLALAGASLAASVLSALWAARGHHLLLLAGWVVVMAGALAVRVAMPGGPLSVAGSEPRARASIDRIAYGLSRVEESGADAPPGTVQMMPSLWTGNSIGRLAAADSVSVASSSLGTIPVGGTHVPVWLVLRLGPDAQASVLAIADGRLGPAAGPLSYRAGDSLAYPGLVTFTDAAPLLARPGAPRLVVDSGTNGVPAGSLARRAVLAWALQAGDLLRQHGPETRVRWHLGPAERLAELLPFVSWERPHLAVAGGALVWLSTGYLATPDFPGSTRLVVGGVDVGGLEAGLVGVVDARTGATSIFQLPDAGQVTRSWGRIAQGLIRPAVELPPAVAAANPYPMRLFEVQARLLELEPWRAGILLGRSADGTGDPAPPMQIWEGGSRVSPMAGYLGGEEGRVRSLVVGRNGLSGRRLTLSRLGEAASLPGPSVAQATWDRFPSYEQMLDSVRRRGGRFERGPFRILPWGDSPIAYQPWYALDGRGRVAQPYLAVASGTRFGAGRSFAEAWDNLRGRGAPLPPGLGPVGPLEEARRWMERADSALHAGDWEAFGRAFGALREALEGGGEEP